VCGTDGLQTHVCIVTQDRKSVRCVLALVSVFLRPRGPPTEVPATFHSCGRMPANDIRGHKAVRCYSTIYEFIFGLCREVPLFS
jgi:hypothetical protein